jgi:hypothetical protein
MPVKMVNMCIVGLKTSISFKIEFFDVRYLILRLPYFLYTLHKKVNIDEGTGQIIDIIIRTWPRSGWIFFLRVYFFHP